MIPPIFQGQAVVICAGGPSLRGFDFRRLSGLNTVAINRAHEFIPDAKILWWSDARYWRRARETLMAHSAPYKATCHLDYYPQDAVPDSVHVYRMTGVNGFDEDPYCLRSGNNSAFAALHLVAHMRPRLIVLLGIDMGHGPHGESHFHDGHGETYHRPDLMRNYMLPHFGSLAKPLADRSIEVINASPNSAVTCWPRCTIDAGLALLACHREAA